MTGAHRLGDKFDGRGAGQGPVVDVAAADEHGIHLLGADRLYDTVDVAGLVVQHPDTVELARSQGASRRRGDRAGRSEARAVGRQYWVRRAPAAA